MKHLHYLTIFCLIILSSVLISRLAVYTSKFTGVGRYSNRAFVIATVPPVVPVAKTEIDEHILMDNSEPVIIKPPKVIVPKPYITAESYLVANLETGETYLEYYPEKITPIASVSKLFTALISLRLFKPEQEMTITEQIFSAYGDAGHLKINEKYTAHELLQPLLLESSNDAAEAFAQSFGYEEFIVAMNTFAKEIGMKNTFFKDASGLSPQNISTAKDLFILAQYLYTKEEEILRISHETTNDLATTTTHASHHFVNINPFSYYTGFIGGKTGRTTEAKESMVSLFDQKVGDAKYPIAVILLRSDLGEREMNTEKILGLFIDKVSK